MTPQRTRIEIPILLPNVPDMRDACVARLEAVLGEQRGVVRAQTVAADGGEGALCLHYDPGLVTLAQVQRLARSAGADISDKFRHEVLAIRAVDGEDATRRIEADLKSLGGVMEASMNLPAQRVRVKYERDKVSIEQIIERLDELGYPAAETGATERAAVPPPKSWLGRNRELALSLVAGALLAFAWIGARWFGLPAGAAVAFYLASYAFGAWDLVGHWTAHLRKGKVTFDIDLLMLLAAIGAAILGEWAEGAFLLFLFSLAHALEHYALGRARNAIRALADLAPATARVMRAGRQVEVPVEDVGTGGDRCGTAGGADTGRWRGAIGRIGSQPGADHRRVHASGEGTRGPGVRGHHQW